MCTEYWCTWFYKTSTEEHKDALARQKKLTMKTELTLLQIK